MLTINDPLVLVLLTALVNGAVTYGVVTTKLAWLRRDVDEARALALEALRLIKARASSNLERTP